MERFNVTVIIPNYNNEQYIIQCMDSVLAQTYSNMRVIIIDDCSTDDSAKIIRKYEEKYSNIKGIYLKQNKGVSNARNIGLMAAETEYVTYIDGDDIYYNTYKLENEMNLIKKYASENIDIVAYSSVIKISIDGNCILPLTSLSKSEYVKADARITFISGNKFHTIPRDYCISKKILEQVGAYSFHKDFYEDLDLLMKLSFVAPFYCTYDYGTGYRQTSGGLSKKPDNEHWETIHEIREKYYSQLSILEKRKVNVLKVTYILKKIIKKFVIKYLAKDSVNRWEPNMKIAIVTLTHNPNFGNTLQNIALTKVLEKLNCNVETIFNATGSGLLPTYGIKNILKIILNPHNCRTMEIKKLRFYKCSKKYIRYSRIIWPVKDKKRLNNTYDYFVVGSDQVWNPCFGFGTDFELLLFADKEKRISYAASFGIEKLPAEVENYFKAALHQFCAISVREENGKDILSSLGIERCNIHLDPTMLLSVKQWEAYSQKPKVYPTHSYMLVYMLGNINTAYKRVFEEIAEKINCVMVDLNKYPYLTINPFEFIWLIRHANFVCTDSFHGSVFSILFHKPFYVFKKINNESEQEGRIETLLHYFELQSRWGTNYGKRDEGIDFDTVDAKIKEGQRESIRYLKMHIIE